MKSMEPTYVKPLRTLMEVYQNLPEGTLAQLIQNQIIMSPAPSDIHQEITGEVYALLLKFVKRNSLGKVRIAPYDVYLNRRNVFQPDIVFIAAENTDRIKTNGLHGAPDLVIEVLSPASWHYDKGSKKDEYERSGVKEYWMIDPATKSTEGFWLANGVYEPIPSEDGKLNFRPLEYVLVF